MTAVVRPSRAPLAWRSWLRSLVRPGPERWVHLVAALGWVALIGHAVWAAGILAPSAPASTGATEMHDMPGMAGMGDMGSASTGISLGWLGLPVIWLAMLAATMLPLVAPNLRYLGLRSARQRRTVATVEAAGGWLLAWGAVAAVLATSSWLLVRAADGWMATIIAFSLAVAWQATRRKRVAIARCHRTFAPPLDATSGAACRRFGIQLGADCATSCWALMGAMAVSGHDLFVVMPLTWVSWFERRRSHHISTKTTTMVVVASTGLIAVTIAALAA